MSLTQRRGSDLRKVDWWHSYAKVRVQGPLLRPETELRIDDDSLRAPHCQNDVLKSVPGHDYRTLGPRSPLRGRDAFRHMHATALLDTGATPKVTHRQLRHADPRVTLNHYVHLIDSSHRKAVERAPAFLDRIGPKIEGSVN